MKKIEEFADEIYSEVIDNINDNEGSDNGYQVDIDSATDAVVKQLEQYREQCVLCAQSFVCNSCDLYKNKTCAGLNESKCTYLIGLRRSIEGNISFENFAI